MFSLLMPHAAALIKTEEQKALVISDPHLGWELALQEKGIHVPSQTPKLLKKLVALLDEHRPDVLLVVGDVKYTVATSEPGEWRDIPDFFSELEKHVPEIGIVRGNHDANLEPMLPENIKIHPATGIVVDEVGLFHGHKWPSPALLGCKTLVMGHLHPVVVFKDAAGFKFTRQAWIRADCDGKALAAILLRKHGVKAIEGVEEALWLHYGVKLRAEQLFIMPSFNDFLGGRPVNESRQRNVLGAKSLIGPVLRSDAIEVDKSEIYLLDGTFLGTLSQLKTA